MLDRLRFQEIEKAIFRVREEGSYGNRYLLKNEPFMIIDNASMSNFKIGERDKTSTGRSVEADTSSIKNVSFNLSNGQIMVNLFNSIFGETVLRTTYRDGQMIDNNLQSSFTVNDVIQVNNEDTITLPSIPINNKVLLYITDDYGNLTRVRESDYSVSNNVITLSRACSYLFTYVYETNVDSQSISTIKQLGTNLILSLEMQCMALDILTEEKIRILIKFDRVSVGTNLSIGFNNSERSSNSVIYVEGLPEENTKVNKPIFTIEVI